MSPEAIIGLTAAISIGFRYLEPIHPDEREAMNIQEQRLLAFDKILTASAKLLKLLGRPKYLESVWAMWSQIAQSMYMLERHLWPHQAPDTELHMVLPQLRDHFPTSC